ncbi:MAG: hypothetical protein KDA57_07510 [Planctomycetales bacterium]|nr:hypothetical protein [Planctomycetales bacterium]
MNSSDATRGLNFSSATRYRFQSLLLFTAGFVAVAATAGVYLRDANVAQQRYLLSLWGCALASFTVWMSCYLWLRRRAEKKAGKVHFRLSWTLWLFNRSFSPGCYGAFLTLCAFWMMFEMSELSAKFVERGGSFWQVLARGHNPGLLLALAMISVWWRKEVWFGDHGIAWLAGFRAWGKIEGSYPHEKLEDTILIELGGWPIRRKVGIRVPSEIRLQVEEFLNQKLPKAHTSTR